MKEIEWNFYHVFLRILEFLSTLRVGSPFKSELTRFEIRVSQRKLLRYASKRLISMVLHLSLILM